MLIDAIIVLFTLVAAIWGYFRGVRSRVLVAVGFGIGALLGSRVGPQLLKGGLHDPLAPLLALPGALLLGAGVAAGMERADRNLRRLLRRHYTLDALGGVVVATSLGVILVWIVAAAATNVDRFDGTVRDSEIIGGLNSVLPPPGPVLATDGSYSAPMPRRSLPPETRADAEVKQDPEVRAAADSVVKVEVRDCQGRGSGSGWIAGDAIVMTNAHVVEGTTRVTVRVEGTGPPYPAQPIHYDRLADIAILRVPEARGERALPIDATPRSFARVAVLGFPFGHRYKARAARLVSVVGFRRRTPDGSGRHPPSFVRSGLGLGPGVSGGPVVDRAGRVVAMIYAGWASDRRRNHLAVASPAMRPALQRARSSSGTVDTGECHED